MFSAFFKLQKCLGNSEIYQIVTCHVSIFHNKKLMNFSYGLTATITCSLDMGMLVIHLSVLEQNCSIIFLFFTHSNLHPEH